MGFSFKRFGRKLKGNTGSKRAKRMYKSAATVANPTNDLSARSKAAGTMATRGVDL